MNKEDNMKQFLNSLADGTRLRLIGLLAEGSMTAAELREAYELAAQYDPLVIAEQFVGGGEYTAAMLGGVALPVIKIEPTTEFYDYEAKYFADDTRYLCPCGLPPEEEGPLQALAFEAFATAGARGWGRVDLMMDQTGNPSLLEINTVPGMTDHSLVPMAARARGMNFDELVWRILEASLEQD